MQVAAASAQRDPRRAYASQMRRPNGGAYGSVGTPATVWFYTTMESQQPLALFFVHSTLFLSPRYLGLRKRRKDDLVDGIVCGTNRRPVDLARRK